MRNVGDEEEAVHRLLAGDFKVTVRRPSIAAWFNLTNCYAQRGLIRVLIDLIFPSWSAIMKGSINTFHQSIAASYLKARQECTHEQQCSGAKAIPVFK